MHMLKYKCKARQRMQPTVLLSGRFLKECKDTWENIYTTRSVSCDKVRTDSTLHTYIMVDLWTILFLTLLATLLPTARRRWSQTLGTDCVTANPTVTTTAKTLEQRPRLRLRKLGYFYLLGRLPFRRSPAHHCTSRSRPLFLRVDINSFMLSSRATTRYPTDSHGSFWREILAGFLSTDAHAISLRFACALVLDGVRQWICHNLISI